MDALGISAMAASDTYKEKITNAAYDSLRSLVLADKAVKNTIGHYISDVEAYVFSKEFEDAKYYSDIKDIYIIAIPDVVRSMGINLMLMDLEHEVFMDFVKIPRKQSKPLVNMDDVKITQSLPKNDPNASDAV